jgi:undecaprenyl-diphosphatase
MITLSRPRSRFRQFAAARFSAEGAAGLHLTCGVLVLVAAAWLFGAIAEQVASNGPVTLVDVQIANWLHAHATPAVTRAMLFVTTWNSVAGVLVMSAVTGVVLWRRGQRHWLLALVATVPCGDAVNVLMKLSFARARPSFINPIVTLDTFSFPSGHAASAALFYGFLACLLMRHAPRIQQRALIVAAAALMGVLVGFSRIYLGAHYLTDVVAGAAEGLAWLAICITAVSTLQRRRAAPD